MNALTSFSGEKYWFSISTLISPHTIVRSYASAFKVLGSGPQ